MPEIQSIKMVLRIYSILQDNFNLKIQWLHNKFSIQLEFFVGTTHIFKTYSNPSPK